jgi:hypothetical protein
MSDEWNRIQREERARMYGIDGDRSHGEFAPAQRTHHCPNCEAAAKLLADEQSARDDAEAEVVLLRQQLAATATTERAIAEDYRKELAAAQNTNRQQHLLQDELREQLAAANARIEAVEAWWNKHGTELWEGEVVYQDVHMPEDMAELEAALAQTPGGD